MGRSSNSNSMAIPMKRGGRIQANDGQVYLPKDIIQHIQSFLSGKQAATMALLSREWYNSWLTRPCLDFDEHDFRRQKSDSKSDDKFYNFVKRSMERYDELNLSIESFKLRMNVKDVDSYNFATEWIAKAVKLGANRVKVACDPPMMEYRLPLELLEAKCLVRLSVTGYRILCGQVMWSRLKSLRLREVRIGDDMIREIMLKCPLLENMILCCCEGLLKINLSKMVKLRRFSFRRGLSKNRPLIEFEDQSAGSIIGNRIIMSEFCYLSYLLLQGVKIDGMFFCDFSKKFPCLVDLTISYCTGCLRYDVKSNSLKNITLADTDKLEIQLDVPNIRKFVFSGYLIPALSLVTSSSEWVSEISFTIWNYLDVTWFLELNNFLSSLNLSKIALDISFFSLPSIDFVAHIQDLVPHIQDFVPLIQDFVPRIQDLPKPTVEKLSLTVNSFTSVSRALFDGIFWSFRPKMITLFSPLSNNKYGVASNDPLYFLCKKLMDQENRKFCDSTEEMIGWHELEEAKAEFFEETLKEWMPLPLQSSYLLDTLRSREKGIDIRFQLTWRTT